MFDVVQNEKEKRIANELKGRCSSLKLCCLENTSYNSQPYWGCLNSSLPMSCLGYCSSPFGHVYNKRLVRLWSYGNGSFVPAPQIT